MLGQWFKYKPAICQKEDKQYTRAASSYFDEFQFSWQRIASHMYPMGTNGYSNRTKNTRYIFRNRIKYQGTKIYDQISDILEKLFGACHFDNVDST